MSKKGRPPKFVNDPNGRPIVGLSFSKSSNCHYATYSKPRIWFTSALDRTLFEFQKYQNKAKEEEPTIELNIPRTVPVITKNGYIGWEDISDSPPVIPPVYEGESVAISEVLFLEKFREMILTDPIIAAKKLGIPELARLDDMPRLDKPLTLKSILKFYIDQKNPSRDEKRKCVTAWRGFCNLVPVTTIREVTSDMIHDYHDAVWKEYKKSKWSNSWLKMRFTKVKTVLNHSLKKGRTNKRELKRVLEWCKCLSVPSDGDASASPIEREDVHKLLAVAKPKMKTAMLLALNCGYYAKDIHDLKKSMIKHKDGLDYIVFPREKNKHMRINVLWVETKKAIDEYMAENPNESEYVFASQFGSLFDPHDVQRCFGRLRVKAGIPKEVKFNNFRDGAATALFGKVSSDLLKVTIGHRIKGEKSKYISVKPKQVVECSKYIWEEYFGE